MSESDSDPSSVVDVFGDQLTRQILFAASERAMSAEEIASTFDTSTPTVYRRLDAMLDHDLLEVHQEIDPEGNHYKTFETSLRRVTLEIEDGEYTINIEMREGLVDQFSAFWAELGENTTNEATGAAGNTNQPGSSRDPHHG